MPTLLSPLLHRHASRWRSLVRLGLAALLAASIGAIVSAGLTARPGRSAGAGLQLPAIGSPVVLFFHFLR